MAARGTALRLRGALGSLALACALLTGTGTASADTFSTLYRFTGDANGNGPSGPLVRATDGNLYGTATGSSGNQTFSTIFRVTPAGVLATLHTFFNGDTNGLNPLLAFQAADGYLYGVTNSGVFRVATDGVVTSLYTFSGGADGYEPAVLIQATDGNLYGMTRTGGSTSACGGAGCGTVFKMTTSGTLTTLYSFTGGADGALGMVSGGALTQGSDGNLYGATPQGGTSGPCEGQSNLGLGYSAGCGTIFKLTLAGTLTTLHTFSGSADGRAPNALVQGADGNLYGTTLLGGAAGEGTTFRITTVGTLTTLYTFTGTLSGGSGSGAPDGFLQGGDGNFYGTTSGLLAAAVEGGNSGGSVPGDTVFEMTPSATLTTLHAFSGTDGMSPSGMVQGSDGNLYGVASGGTFSSSPRYGSIFREALSTGTAAGGSSGGGGAGSWLTVCMLTLGLALRQRRRLQSPAPCGSTKC